jgi:hypothetical protein
VLGLCLGCHALVEAAYMGIDGTLGRPSRLRQSVNRSRLLETARSKDILVEVVANRDGYLDMQAVDWETYWQPHGRAARPQLDRRPRWLFYRARMAAIRASVGPPLAR